MEELYLSEKQLACLLNFYNEPSFTTGPIFGQCDGTKKYMVHVAQAADPMATVLPSTETIDQIDISTLAEHAKQAFRVLPGGMSVLGIFVVGPKLVSEDKWSESLLLSLELLIEMCSSDVYEKGTPSNKKLILLSAKAPEGMLECICCDFEQGNLSVKPMECRVVPEIVWHEVAAMVDLDVHIMISKKSTASPLWEQLKPMLLRLEEKIANNGITFPRAGLVKNKDLVSEVLRKQQKNLCLTENDDSTVKNKLALMVDVMLREDLFEGKDMNIVIQDGSKMVLSGTVVCRTYVHGDADVQLCKKVVNEDVMHSLVARLEMHCDSLVEEEPDDVCDEVVIHEPPRRMMVRLPCSEVLFSDYLFPGELVTEAKQSLQSLLGVSVHDIDVLHTFAGLSEFKSEELNTRTTENTSVLAAKNDILQFVLLLLAVLAPVIALLVFHHQQ